MTTTAILLMILCLIAAGVLLAALAPFTVAIEMNVSSEKRRGVMHAQWLHPWIMRWTYNVEQCRSEVKVLGKTLLFTERDISKTEPLKAPASNCSKPPADASQLIGKGDFIPCKKPVIEKESWTDNKSDKMYHPPRPVFGERPLETIDCGLRKIKYFYSILRDVNNRRAFSRMLRWCRRVPGLVFKMIHFYRLRLYAKAGTGDPAEIGKIYGYYVALDRLIFRQHRNVDVRFTPEFSSDMFECCGSIAVRTSFARVVLPLLTALVTFPYLPVYFVWRRLKKNKSLENNEARHDFPAR